VTVKADVVNSAGTPVSNAAITWNTSNAKVATVSPTGAVTLLAVGTAQITATADSVTAGVNCTVTNTPAPVAVVKVSPTTLSLAPTQYAPVSATEYDSTGNELTGRTVTWTTSNANVATVSTSGIVTAIAVGSAIVTATSEGKVATVAVTVAAVAVAQVVVTPAAPSLNVGQTAQLSAVLKDSAGDALTGRSIAWSTSDASVATVSTSGLVTAVKAGSASITASSGGKSGVATATVTAAPVASLSVTPTQASIGVGKNVQLTAIPKTAAGATVASVSTTWSSANSGIASVNGTGLVTGVAAGGTTITVSAAGFTVQASITVTASAPAPVASVVVAPASSALTVGQTVQLTATDESSTGATTTGTTPTWTSSNTAVATVSSSGVVTAVAAGSATITATSSSKSGAGTVTVSAASTGQPNHEPSGFTAQINTGPMTNAPATSYPANTWTQGTATFTNYSPTTVSSTGEWDQNLSKTPDGSGVRVTYPTNLEGGNSPVRFGTSIPNSGSGSIYLRWRFRLSPNWTLSTASGLKVIEPRTINAGENHVLGYGSSGLATDGSNMWFGALLQFNNSGYYAVVPGNSLGQSPASATSTDYDSPLANFGGSARGTWHWSEALFTHESVAGTPDGRIQLWVDGTLVFDSNDGRGVPSGGIRFFERGESMGWNFIMFDPTYGGDASSDHPPYSIYWDIDQLYVSTK